MAGMGSYNPSLTEALPDLQHRMGKKISQLTRVIYHLNNKSEDHDFELQDLAGQYESEIEQILKEAAERMKAFKEAAEAQREEGRTQEVIRVLREQHEKERKAALAEFSSYKLKVKEREAAIQKAADLQVEALIRDVTNLRSDLAKRGEEVKKSVDSTSAAIASIQDLKRAHKGELEEERSRRQREVAETNERAGKQYSDMLAARLAQEETLRLEISTISAAAQRELLATKEEYEAKLAQLEAEKQSQSERLEGVLSTSADTWKAQEQDLKGQLADLRKSLEAEVAQSTAVRSTLEQREADLQATSAKLHQEEAKRASLEESLSATRMNGSEISERLQEALWEIAEANASIESQRASAREAAAKFEAEIAAKEDHIATMETVLEKEREEVKAREHQILLHSSKIDGLQLSLATTKKSLEISAAECSQLKQEMGRAQQELARREGEIKKFGADANRKAGSLEAEISRLQDELSAQAMRSREAEKEEKVRHQKALRDAIDAHTKQMEELKRVTESKTASQESAFNAQLAEEKRKLEKDHLEEMEALATKHAEDSRLAAERTGNLQDELEQLKKEMSRMESAKKSHEDLVASLQREAEDRSRKYEAVRRSLESRLVQAAESEATLRVELAAIRDQANKAGADHSGAAALADSLNRQLAEQRRLHEASMAEVETRHARDLQRCNEDWAKRSSERVKDAMDAAKRNHAMEVRVLQEEWNSRKEVEKEELRQEIEAQAVAREAKLRKEMDAIESAHVRALGDSNARIASLSENSSQEVQALRKAHEDQLSEARKKREEDLRQLSEKHAAELAAAADRSLQALAEARQLAARELESARSIHSDDVARMEGLLEATVSEWRTRVATEIAMLADRHEEEMQAQKKALTESHAKENASVESRHRKEAAQLRARLGSLDALNADKEKALATLKEAKTEVEERLVDARADLQAKHAQLVTTTADLQKAMREMQQKLQRTHKAEMDSLSRDKLAQVQSLQEQAAQAQAATEEKYKEMQARFDRLQARFNNRESRVEDVARISELEKLCIRKDTEFNKLFEDTKQMRLELLNREENYNRVFGNSPNVQQNTLEWLKIKGKDSGRTAKPASAQAPTKSTSSSRRTSDNRVVQL